MTSISRNVYIDKLNATVNEYNNTYHRTIKMKPVYVKDDPYINVGKEVDNKDPKLKVGDHVRIWKYKNIFATGYTPNRTEEFFAIKKIKNAVPWTYIINDEEWLSIIGTLYEKDLQKNKSKKIRTEKVIKKKGNKLYVKWKGYDNPFNSWIDKKDVTEKWVSTFLNDMNLLEKLLMLKL